MKILNFIAFICLLQFAQVSAASDSTYKIDLDLFQGTKKLFSPTVELKVGEPTLVTQKEGKIKSFIEVVVVQGVIENVKGLILKVIAGTINSNGTRTILSKPEFIVSENEPTKISMNSSYGNLSLNILANKKN